MTTLVSAIGMCIGSALIGFIIGHRKGFYDGFDYAVVNSEKVSKKLAKEMMDTATMRIFKKEADGRFTEVKKPVEEKSETVE